jgi:hypothetical protein
MLAAVGIGAILSTLVMGACILLGGFVVIWLSLLNDRAKQRMDESNSKGRGFEVIPKGEGRGEGE